LLTVLEKTSVRYEELAGAVGEERLMVPVLLQAALVLNNKSRLED